MKALYILSILFFVSAQGAFAESSSKDLRSQSLYRTNISYSFIDLWLPNKLGINGSYQLNGDLIEIGYERASLNFDFFLDDLGNISEDKLIAQYRSFSDRNSFNYQYGVYYRRMQVNLGSKFMEGVTQVDAANFDFIDSKTIGVLWGIGNQWEWDNGVLFGIDWLKIQYPLFSFDTTTDFLDLADNADKKDDIKKLINIFEKTPTGTLLKFQFGYRF